MEVEELAERSRVEELAEEVMTKEQLARKKELEDIERAAYNFEGTRLELVADELLRSLPGRSRSPKHHHRRRYSPSSSSSVSSSSPSSSGSFTPVTNRSPERKSLHSTTTATMDAAQTRMAVPDELQTILPALQRVVPVLAPGRHKGQAGKVAVVGGCREYTGAPYFAAISALKMGADLAHVFCTEGAATVIKSYSPELIVHPVLHESYDLGEIGEQEIEDLKQKVLEDVGKWLPRFDCIVIGPGLGRESILLECVAGIIEEAKSKNIPLVIDGDGLFLVTNRPELIIGYPLAVLTPNVMEHKRLVAKINSGNPQEISDEDLPGQLQELAKKFQSAKSVGEENPKEPSDEEDPENPKEPSDEEDPENPKEPSDEEDPENPKEPSDEEESENPKELSDEEDLPGQLQKLADKFQNEKIAREGNLENLKEESEEELRGQLQELAKKMEGVTIVQKGKTDYISDGKTVLSSGYYGSPRRCGGQGDVLSGSTAVFVAWAKAFFSNENADGKKDVQERISDNPTMVGALAGSLLVRKSAANAFALHKRSTVTTNLIEAHGHSMDELFPM